MKEFDLSEKELKSLLKEDAIESPSMGFNQAILAKIDAHQKTQKSPIKTPHWLIFGVVIIFTAPSIYFFSEANWDFNALFKDLELPSLAFDFTVNTTYLWIGILTIGVICMAMLFDKFLLNSSRSHR